MGKLWEGRADGNTEKAADEFNSSISVDQRMYRQDIAGSIAHAAMLGETGIIEPEEAETIINALQEINSDIESGKLAIDPEAEDIHMFVEAELTARTGDTGKKLHTARSRNDQVALDSRLYLRDETDAIASAIRELILTLCNRAEEYKDAVMPGYTHLQRAQPVTFGHHLMAYAMMLLRDMDRLYDLRSRICESPIGCCALAGTTYPTDRNIEADMLGFDRICMNSIDGVSDRDYCVELASDIAMIMMHLSRLSEELVLWSSWEFGFVSLSDGYTTGSSIMPQKKNPDMAELIRGKTGRVYGNLMGLLTVLKGLPLAYNKDMQEDKEGVFDSCDTVKACTEIMNGMIATMTVRPERMLKAAREGFINATDLADYLVGKGMPFRDAYKISGKIVAECIEKGLVLETLPLEDYRAHSELFGEDLYDAINLAACVDRRTSYGGTSVGSVEKQIEEVRNLL